MPSHVEQIHTLRSQMRSYVTETLTPALEVLAQSGQVLEGAELELSKLRNLANAKAANLGKPAPRMPGQIGIPKASELKGFSQRAATMLQMLREVS